MKRQTRSARLWKQTIAAALVAVVIGTAVTPTPARADDTAAPVTVVLDGQPLQLDPGPRLINGQPYAPAQTLFAALGGEATATSAGEAAVTISNQAFTFRADSALVFSTGSSRPMESPARMVDGALFVPVRAAARLTDHLFFYTSSRRRAVLVSQGQKAPARERFLAAYEAIEDRASEPSTRLAFAALASAMAKGSPQLLMEADPAPWRAAIGNMKASLAASETQDEAAEVMSTILGYLESFDRLLELAATERGRTGGTSDALNGQWKALLVAAAAYQNALQRAYDDLQLIAVRVPVEERFRGAKRALAAGDPDRALRLLSVEGIAARESGGARHLAGQAYLVKGEADRALVEFKAAVPLFTDFRYKSATLLQSAAAQVNRKDAQGALADLQEALRLHPANVEAQLLLGVIISETQLGTAKEALENALRQMQGGSFQPWAIALAHFHLGRIAERLGDQARAEQHYRVALDKNPLLQDAGYRLGVILLRQKKWAEAEAALLASGTSDDGQRKALATEYSLNARDARDQKNLRDAEGLYRAAVALHPSGDDYWDLGWVRSQLGDNDGALSAYSQALLLLTDPKSLARVHYNVGVVHERRKSYAAALERYLTAQRLDPTYLSAPVATAWIYHRLQRYDEAIELAQSAAARASSPQEATLFARAQRFAAWALMAQRKYDDAEAALQKAIAAAPKDSFVLGAYGVLEGRRKNWAEAEKLTKAAIEAAAGDPAALAAHHGNMGWILRNTGRREEAIAHLRKALSYEPGNDYATKELRSMGEEP